MSVSLGHMFQVARWRGRVPVLVHWSVPAIVLFALGAWVGRFFVALAALASYLGILVIHELGHAMVARRRGCRVLSIEIYPIHGRCVYEATGTRFDHALIAWGGVAAQFVVAAPLAMFVLMGGYRGFEPLNAVLAILGFISPVIALINLLPMDGVDGKRAWSLLPMLWSKRRGETRTRAPQTPMEAMEEALRKARRRSEQ